MMKMVIQSFRMMPEGLRMFVIGYAILGVFAGITLFTDGWKDENGQSITNQELWASGAAWWVVLSSVLLLTFSVLTFLRSRFARPFSLGVIIYAIGYSFFDPEYKEVPPIILIPTAAFGVAYFGWYFYFSRGVRAYFSEREDSNKTSSP